MLATYSQIFQGLKPFINLISNNSSKLLQSFNEHNPCFAPASPCPPPDGDLLPAPLLPVPQDQGPRAPQRHQAIEGSKGL